MFEKTLHCDRKIIALPVNQSQSKGISVDVKVRIRRRGNLRRKLTSADWETNLSIKSGAVLPTGKKSAALDDAIQHSSFDSFVVVTQRLRIGSRTDVRN